MDSSSRNRYFNIIFLGIFFSEIIIYIKCLFILPIRTDWLILSVSIIFMSGIYAFLKKTLLYLLAFCVVNMVQISLLIDLVRFEIHFCSLINDIQLIRYDMTLSNIIL
ncbi:hypothetical protein C1646_270719 [Rhizophagus diaphanus]|nr:hypothetical protein C1646_270719 [Rhizophagus diaphanus] [Rhizophagus sp. MUCL 43196]